MSIIKSNKQNQKNITNGIKHPNHIYRDDKLQEPLSQYMPSNSQITRQNYFKSN